MNQVDEVKKIIRSLLVSSPVKVTVASLDKDYKQLEGFNIPFRELGYNSLLHFMHSIPDILLVKGSSIQSEVSLVVSEKVAHVNDMVMKQKRPSKGRKSLLQRKSVISPPSTSYNAGNYRGRNNTCFRPAGSNRTYFRSPMASPIYYCPPVMISSPVNSQVNFRSPIIHQFDYRSPISNYPYITSLFNQPVMRSPMVNQNFRAPTVNQPKNYAAASLSPFPRPLMSPKEKIQSFRKHSPEVITKNEEKKTDDSLEEVQCKIAKLRLRKSKSRRINMDLPENVTLTFDMDKTNGEKGLINVVRESSKIPSKVVDNLQELISKHPNGILCTELSLEYRKVFGQDLNFEAYGFSSVINLCLSLESIFQCEKASDWDFKVYDQSKYIPKLMNYTNEHEERRSNSLDNPMEPFSIKATPSPDWNVYSNVIPDNVVKLGEAVENHSATALSIGDSIQIVVSEIYNPNNFWVYKDDGNLDSMMNSMQIFYKDHSSTYIIPEFLLDVGLYCVVRRLGEFQRGIILDLLPSIGGRLKVFLIDFGTIFNAMKDEIWFLCKDFSTLTAQAIAASLDNVEPIGDRWSGEINIKFKEFVAHKHILMKICGITEKGIQVSIADKKFPCDFLNDVLVAEKLAKYSRTKDSDGTVQNNQDKIRAKAKLVQRVRAMRQMNNSSSEGT